MMPAERIIEVGPDRTRELRVLVTRHGAPLGDDSVPVLSSSPISDRCERAAVRPLQGAAQMIALRARQRSVRGDGAVRPALLRRLLRRGCGGQRGDDPLAVSTFGGVETESSYKAGLAFKPETAASGAAGAWMEGRCADRAGRRGRHGGGRGARCSGSGRAAPRCRDRPGASRRQARDVTMAVAESPPAFFVRRARSSGRRTLMIELTRNGERMFRSVNRS